jgi:hypothetical protein
MNDPAKDRGAIDLFEGYKTHYERWAEAFVEAPADSRPSEVESPRQNPTREKSRYEMPATYLYWTLGAALGALLLGIATVPGRPIDSVKQELPKTELVRVTEPQVVPVIATDSQDSPDAFFMIMLDPLPQHHNAVSRELEETLKKSLAREGFPNIGVSVGRHGDVYLAGTLFDHSEKGEIRDLVSGTPGVSRVHFSDMRVRKLYGPAYFGAETERSAGGVLVEKIYGGSPAEMAGIRTGDVITRFGGQRVTDPEAFRYMVMSRVGGQRIPVGLRRDGQEHTVTVRLGELPALASM